MDDGSNRSCSEPIAAVYAPMKESHETTCQFGALPRQPHGRTPDAADSVRCCRRWRPRVHEHRSTALVYVTLRVLVIVTMVLQFLNGQL